MSSRYVWRNTRWAWLCAVAILLLLDQSTKWYFSTTMQLGSATAVTEWFNLVYVRNAGAAFSFLANAGGWQRWFFIGLSVLVVGAIAFACLTGRVTPLERWAGAFVAGGGGGNLIDRVQTGAVVDFLDFHWRGIHWPAFNLADVFIVCAALTWFVASLKTSPGQQTQTPPRGALP